MDSHHIKRSVFSEMCSAINSARTSSFWRISIVVTFFEMVEDDGANQARLCLDIPFDANGVAGTTDSRLDTHNGPRDLFLRFWPNQFDALVRPELRLISVANDRPQNRTTGKRCARDTGICWARPFLQPSHRLPAPQAASGRNWRVFAAHKHDLVLVGRSADKLASLSGELSRAHGIQSHVLAADLTDAAAPPRLFQGPSLLAII
jgi:hypothetical protein